MGRYGMAGNYYRRSGYVTLQDVPDPNREYVETFDNLTGGMNTFDLDFRLKGNESPFMQNLTWKNGALSCRRGQVKVGEFDIGQVNFGEVHRCYDQLWHGWIIVHEGTGLCAMKLQADPEVDPEQDLPVGTNDFLFFLDSEVPGDFARYHQYLFYKTRNAFVRLEYALDEALGTYTFTAVDVLESAYVPCIRVNADPNTGAGEQYQPENRLTQTRRLTYNGDGVTTEYHIPKSSDPFASLFDRIIPTEVYVNGDQKTKGVDWYGASETSFFFPGTVTFETAPPAGQNNVEIVFKLNNSSTRDAHESLVSCNRMAVFGGAQDLCLVLGGCEAQPNAYFWSGNTSVAMDPTYFPMNQYNLAGDAADEITGFGKQQNMLVIFQPRGVGRAVMGTEEISGRVQITMNYTRINAQIGCDLPRSIQLVENNLVWCNRKLGVCRLKDSSAAYENNITPISRKINGDKQSYGLLYALKGVDVENVRSMDTGERYIVTIGDQAYEWNYELSEHTNPSWFYHTGIKGCGFAVTVDDGLYEVDSSGAVWGFQEVLSDGGAPIEKVYTFPPRNFGSYDRLKNIQSILVTTRGDLPANTQLEYKCDYGSRIDPTPITSDGQTPFAVVARRKPGYHNIRHLRIKLYNNELNEDMSVVSAQIFYTFRGRQR